MSEDINIQEDNIIEDQNNGETEQISKSRSLIRLILSGIGIIIIAYVCVTIMPEIISLLKEGDTAAMEAYISSLGAKGVIMLVALQVIQTITIFFPGIPIYMCSGIVYGKLWGTLICYITYVVINVAVFIFVRRMKEAAFSLINKDDDSGMGELMKKTKYPQYLVMALCVIPVVPNGMVPYIASPSKITLKQFIVSVAIGCIPGIFLFVCCGDLLMTKYFWLIIGLMIGAVALMIIGMIFKKKLSGWAKEKMSKLFGSKE